MKFTESGSEEVMVEKISYSQSGDTLIWEKPLEKKKMMREYNTDRKMMKEENYKDGKPDGKWTYYNADGSLKGGGIYQNGRRFNGWFVRYRKTEKGYRKIEERYY